MWVMRSINLNRNIFRIIFQNIPSYLLSRVLFSEKCLICSSNTRFLRKVMYLVYKMYLFSFSGFLFQCNWKKYNSSNQSSRDNSNMMLSEWLIIFNTTPRCFFYLFIIYLNFDLLRTRSYNAGYKVVGITPEWKM